MRSLEKLAHQPKKHSATSGNAPNHQKSPLPRCDRATPGKAFFMPILSPPKALWYDLGSPLKEASLANELAAEAA
jgi:hypothetical protein